MAYLNIHDYGIIGDMQSCALVGLNGSIDWACFPYFDSPSSFAALLDDTKGGRFAIAPVEPYSVKQRYLPNTNVLETTFTTESGRLVLTDFMHIERYRVQEQPNELYRIVRGDSGEVRVRVVFEPRMDYSRGKTDLVQRGGCFVATHGEEAITLRTPLALSLQTAEDGGPQAAGEFLVGQGDEEFFSLVYGLDAENLMDQASVAEKERRTADFWHQTVGMMHYDGLWREEVTRSFLVLHLLMFAPAGSVVAAPTTSLPERIGGIRNWDYRFTWLRDAAWTVGVLYRLGDRDDGEAFMKWMVERCWLSRDRMQILYGIRDDSTIQEVELNHLRGYRDSRPVRIGNGAAFHRQLDVFGEVVVSLTTYVRYHGRLPEHGWEVLQKLADLAADTWRMPDRGIWEVRGPERHFVYSKLMCWLALDRAAWLAETHGFNGDSERWKTEAANVRAEILEHGWSDKKQAFIQHYDSESLDASILIMPFIGFLETGDPRLHSTVKAVQSELASGPFVRRYRTEETDDGVGGEEGCFYMLSFWLVGALLAVGEHEEAVEIFNEVYETRNHLGLFAEMIDPENKLELGNFPQAFSHIGFLHTARNLSLLLKTHHVEEDLLA